MDSEGKFYQTNQWVTREVMVGGVGVGGNNPIRIQSMTTSDTRDIPATIEQIIRLADEGCEIVRVTVQGKKEAEACAGIKEGLLKRGYSIPLVADIHFYPPAALLVAEYVDKVRINPGNFIDKRASFKTIVYDDKTYEQELERLEEKFVPLVEKCKRLKRAMRIGTNHGSLSDRIMNRYGDTPRGMVESALEFAKVCRKYDYHDLIFSMKASHTQVMIEAYRLLVEKMQSLGWDYPLHLGVTEAGEGEDGRVKSAIGIGTLLLEGIGDTIRVSLTEDPWREIDPCKRLASLGSLYRNKGLIHTSTASLSKKRTPSFPPSLHRDGSVALWVSKEEVESESFFSDLGCSLEFGKPKRTSSSVDVLLTQEEHPKLEKLKAAGISVVTSPYRVTEDEKSWEKLLADTPSFALFDLTSQSLKGARAFFAWLQEKDLKLPVLLQGDYTCSPEDLPIHAGAEVGSLLCDRLGEGICLKAGIPLRARRELCFAILQGARMRASKTEFISCPGCGRTLFDLQTTSEAIRRRTAHLPGVKIAIMGCIVNGPGEMADADFGYVGSLPGKIDLYIGKQCVEKHIPMESAVDRLVTLIKQEGRWIEPISMSCTTSE